MSQITRKLLCGFFCALASYSTHATWSILGSDTVAGEIGAASATCYESFGKVYTDVLNHNDIYTPIPNASVVLIQQALGIGNSERFGFENISKLANEKMRAEDILNIGSRHAPEHQKILNLYNQYGVLVLEGGVATFTGDWASVGWIAGKHSGVHHEISSKSLTYQYAAIGNTLSNKKVVMNSAEAFEQPACDLAERLMNALEAGQQDEDSLIGDIRCVQSNIQPNSATEAFIRVERPFSEDPLRESPYLFIEVEGTRGAVDVLRKKFNIWRKENSCQGMPLPTEENGT